MAHLYGWRKAETSYRAAYEQNPTEALKDKLLLTLVLQLTRERAEDIFHPETYSQIRPLCATAAGPRQQALCHMAERYQTGVSRSREEPSPRTQPPVDPSPFDYQRSDLEAYLHLLLLKTYDAQAYVRNAYPFMERFPDSPLFVYTVLGVDPALNLAEREARHPEFAELFVFAGTQFFYDAKFKSAVNYFQKALLLIPDYTKALDGLGNLYFFTLRDYASALAFYETSLQRNPHGPAALFGKGAALHHLGAYERSNAALAAVLDQDLSRDGRLDAKEVNYYQGEAYYYQAHNFSLMGDRVKARERINAAKSHLPNSETINHLSGWLYFEAGQWPEAEADFMEALANGHLNCSARYYVGLINHARKDRRFTEYFLGAGACLEQTIRGLEKELAAVDSMDLEDGEKQALRGRLQAMVSRDKAASVTLISNMVQKLGESEVADQELYKNLLREILGRIRPDSPTDK